MKSDSDNKFSAKKIAEQLEIPQPFLAQLLRTLTSYKQVSSMKGPGGGFFLNEDNLSNTLWDIVVSIDGEYKFDDCFLGLVKCDNTNPCPVHHLVAPFKEALLDDFKKKTLSEIVREIEENGTVISLKGLDHPN